MIVRLKLPERLGYMALRLDHEGAWVPITGRVSKSAALAQQLCISDIRGRLADIIESLTTRLQTASANIARLLDQPQRTDRVTIGGFERNLDSDGSVIIDEWQLDDAIRRGAEKLSSNLTKIDDLTWKSLEKTLDMSGNELAAHFQRLLEYIKHNPMPLLDVCEANQPERFHALAVLLVKLYRELRAEGSELSHPDSEPPTEISPSDADAPPPDENGEPS